MKQLQTVAFLLAIQVILFSCQKVIEYAPSDEFVNSPLSAGYTERLNKVLDSACSALQLKGASVAILVPDVGIWKGAYGQSHTGVPINSGMAMTIGSNTKTYIATLLLKLQEMNKLNINDTIGKWIQNKPYVNGGVTIKQLLNHTSGFGDFSFNPAFIDAIRNNLTRVWDPEEAYPYFEPPYFTPPGSSYSYSDQNYVLAGMVIKAVTGKPVEKSMRELLLAPLNLPNTVYYPFETTPLTIPHSWSADFNVSNTFEDLNAVYGYTIKPFCSADNAAGGMLSTAEENARFWNRLLSGKIINQVSLSQMKQFIETGGGQGYGLGLVVQANAFNGRSVYYHDGYVPGSINSNAADTKSGVCISILTNQDKIRDLSPITAALHKVTLQFSK
jgi:D-alanyl-D-alanine carboxypeptidase